ncbi:MAG: hypothetical protein IJN07_07220 [Clostridia bacterium]|nr:hypothetical protein [Clostridia bacterium]
MEKEKVDPSIERLQRAVVIAALDHPTHKGLAWSYFINQIAADRGKMVAEQLYAVLVGSQVLNLTLALEVHYTFPTINPQWLFAGFGPVELRPLQAPLTGHAWCNVDTHVKHSFNIRFGSVLFKSDHRLLLTDRAGMTSTHSYRWRADTRRLEMLDTTYLVCDLTPVALTMIDLSHAERGMGALLNFSFR